MHERSPHKRDVTGLFQTQIKSVRPALQRPFTNGTTCRNWTQERRREERREREGEGEREGSSFSSSLLAEISVEVGHWQKHSETVSVSPSVNESMRQAFWQTWCPPVMDGWNKADCCSMETGEGKTLFTLDMVSDYRIISVWSQHWFWWNTLWMYWLWGRLESVLERKNCGRLIEFYPVWLSQGQIRSLVRLFWHESCSEWLDIL